MCASFSNVEFLKYTYEHMVREGRVVMANCDNYRGKPSYELFMCTPFLDMVGATEFYRPGLEHSSRVFRSVLYQKPSSVLFEGRSEGQVRRPGGGVS